MNRSRLGLLTVIAGAAGLLCFWLGKTILESLLGKFIEGSVDWAGRPGWAALFLTCGLSLGFGGPPIMAWENRKRIAAGKTPRYCGVEFGVIVVAGLAFTLAGIASLLGYW
jgi:hypothetical protein